MQSGTNLLHDGASDNVFEGFLELTEGCEDRLGYSGAPLVHSVDLIGVVSDDTLDALLDDFVDIVRDEAIVSGLVVVHPDRVFRLNLTTAPLFRCS